MQALTSLNGKSWCDDSSMRGDECPANGDAVLGRLAVSASKQCRVHTECLFDDSIQVRQSSERLEIPWINILNLFIDLVCVFRMLAKLAEDGYESYGCRFTKYGVRKSWSSYGCQSKASLGAEGGLTFPRR